MALKSPSQNPGAKSRTGSRTDVSVSTKLSFRSVSLREPRKMTLPKIKCSGLTGGSSFGIDVRGHRLARREIEFNNETDYMNSM